MLKTETPLENFSPQEPIYALDIGTRSVIGMLGEVDQGRVRILAVDKQPHQKRSMMDGQIEDIAQVASAVMEVTARLEAKTGRKLTKACVAAAGRSLRMEHGHGELELERPETIGTERLGQLEAAAVANGEEALRPVEGEPQRLFLVGYTVTRLALDGYPMSSLLGHTGKHMEVDVVATFLPSEVIDSLYAVMAKAGLEVASLTLEPIAALNAAIPKDLRLLNLALVDIGAGTSDIAICRDGGVVGYTMATVAGDEITEAIMRAYLVDYTTAEDMKLQLEQGGSVVFTDVLGEQQQCETDELMDSIDAAVQGLADEIADRIQQLNGGPPSALFLAGGRSKMLGLRERVAKSLGINDRRAALSGNHFKTSACSDVVELEDPEYTTPLGIAISAGLGLISDSYRILLNGKPAKLFRNGTLTVLELLMMNGYGYRDLLGKNGRSMVLNVDGKRMVFPGEPAVPAQLRINGSEVSSSTVVHAGDQVEFIPAKAGQDRRVLAGEVMRRVNGQKVFQGGMELQPEEEVGADEPLTTTFVPQVKENPQTADTPIGGMKEPAACSLVFNGNPLTLPGKPDGGPYYLMDLLEYSGIDFQHLDRPVRLEVNGREGSFSQVLQQGDRVEIRYDNRGEN